MTPKVKFAAMAIVMIALCSIVWATVGTTRISGSAGAGIDLRAYLAGDLSEIGVPVSVSNQTWEYGTSEGEINVIYADTITIADDANDTLDLYASGTLLDIYNRALTMESIKFLYLKNNSDDATLEVFGNETTDIGICATTADIVYVKPGGVFVWVDPTSSGTDITTNKNLFLNHDGTGTDSMPIDVIAMGVD